MSAGRALPLARVPYPCPNEHPAGYLRRLAEANGFFTLRQLRLLHGVEPLSPRSEPAAWQRLSRATALTMETFSLLRWKRMTTAGGTWLSVYGHAVRLADLDLFHLRICPLCIHANGVVRAEWSMRHVTACPIHEVQLLDRCSNCGRPALADERTDVWNCGQCGSFRKSHFLSALAEGSIAAWRISDAPGLAGFHFDSREILRLRAEAQLRAWADADEQVSLSKFNAEACSVWGPKALLDMRECGRLARLGRITMTRYEPPGENSRRQKRWSARDLIAHAEQGRTRLIDAQRDDQARHKPPMERKRKPRL